MRISHYSENEPLFNAGAETKVAEIQKVPQVCGALVLLGATGFEPLKA
jgi:hypothetical protein